MIKMIQFLQLVVIINFIKNVLQNGDSVFYLGNKYIIEIKKGSNNNIIILNNKLLLIHFKNRFMANSL